jgi:glycosyltransferase involved in cell wall biosynthesis
MKILYFDPKFVTPRHSGPTRAYLVARRLIERGHDVTMIARDRRWLAVGRTAPPPLLWRREDVDGIDVVWLRVPYEQRFSKAKRLFSYAAYAAAASVAALPLGKADVVYASSTPLTAGIPGALTGWLRGAPFVFELLDLWPAAPAALGYLSPAELAFSEWLERQLYARADRLVVCSDAVRSSLLRRGIPPRRIELIPNFADTELFDPAQSGDGFRRQHGLAGKFVAIYTGAMGASNGTYQLADAAEALKREGNASVQIVAVGDGSERGLLERRIESEGLDNLLLLPSVPREEVPALVAASDVTLTVFAPHPALALNAPNKFFDSLAAGKPVIVNLHGWLQRVVEENDAGVYVPAGDGVALAGALTSLASAPDRVRQMGENGRRVAVRDFGRERLTDRLASLLEAAADEGPRA